MLYHKNYAIKNLRVLLWTYVPFPSTCDFAFFRHTHTHTHTRFYMPVRQNRYVYCLRAGCFGCFVFCLKMHLRQAESSSKQGLGSQQAPAVSTNRSRPLATRAWHVQSIVGPDSEIIHMRHMKIFSKIASLCPASPAPPKLSTHAPVLWTISCLQPLPVGEV